MNKILFTFLIVLMTCNLAAQTEAWRWLNDDPETVSILLMGDTNIQFREKPQDAFKHLLPTLNAADMRILNLEGPFSGASTDPNAPDIPHKLWRHSEPDQVAALTAAGIDVVGVANNVTFPWQALMRSLKVLDEAGIPHAGGGENLAAAHTPYYAEIKGLRIAYMQYAATVFPYNHEAKENRPGIAAIKVYTAYQPPRNLDKPGQPPYIITWMDDASKKRMVDDVRKMKENADIVIVSYHWGVSGSSEIVSYQEDISKAVIDAGADVVFGHGPHEYQKVQIYKGKPVMYSLAQIIFDDTLEDRITRMRHGLLARVVVKDKKIHSVSLVPSWRGDDGFVRLQDPNVEKGRELYGYLQSVNHDGADISIEGKEIVIHGIQQ